MVRYSTASGAGGVGDGSVPVAEAEEVAEAAGAVEELDVDVKVVI